MRVATRKSQIGIFLALLGLLGGAGFYLFQHSVTPVPAPPQGNSQVSQSQTPVPQEQQVSVYWIEATDRKLKAVPRVVKALNGEEALGEALKQLFAPPPEGFYSGIPAEAKLLNFSANDRDVFINVSAAFREGGGAASMVGRVVQVLYTATSLNPDANVFLLVEGEPIGVLGGEGLEIKQPMTRKDLPLEF